MRADIQQDFEKSVNALRDLVFPALCQWCPEFQGQKIEVLHDHRDRVQYDLDTIAGIDAYQRTPQGLRAIAARVQFGSFFRTFTIRAARPNHAVTELEKRLSQVTGRESGILYPYWTLHAYLSADGKHLSHLGLARTLELYCWIVQQYAGYDPQNLHPPLETRWSREHECFLVIPWDRYRRSGKYLFEYPSPNPTR